MGGQNQRRDQPDARQLEWDRLDGELEAAIVFAAAALDAYRTGKTELAEAALTDARDIYTKSVEELSRLDLTAANPQSLRAKLEHLRESLDRMRPRAMGSAGEAA